MQQPNGPEVRVSRVKKAVFLLHSEDVSFFPSHSATVIEGGDALVLHSENVANFPPASAPVVVRGACIRPIYDCFVAENFALGKLQCYTLEGGFYTQLTFEKSPKFRCAIDIQEVERLFASVAESVCFVPKQNSVGVFAQGLKGIAHLRRPAPHFDFCAGRLQAYS